jgi:membrane protease YdiL (CAAX protease family)
MTPSAATAEPALSRGYLRSARTWTYSAVLALPVLLAYEVGVLLVDAATGSGVRNGADALLRDLAGLLGPRALLLPPLAVAGTLLALVAREQKDGPVTLRRGYLLGMAGEAAVYALLFGTVAGRLTALLIPDALASLSTGSAGMPLWAEVVLSLGAGFYEEVVFRGLVLNGLRMGLNALGIKGLALQAAAVVGSALLFSAYHYLGPLGDTLQLGSFAFRFVAGLLLSGLMVARGFGITVLTHALYDTLFAFGLH